MRKQQSRAVRIQNAAVFTALGIVFVMILGSALLGWFRREYPATPKPLVISPPSPPAATLVLQTLAYAAAQGKRVPAVAAGRRVAYTSQRVWQLAPSGSRRTVAPVTYERWLTTDGVEVQRELRNGARAATRFIRAPRGALQAMQLASGRARLEAGTAMPPALRLLSIAEVAALPPRLEASLLRALSAVPGVAYEGVTTDRAGRSGVALQVPVQSSQPPSVFVFSPKTGALLEVDSLAGPGGARGAQAGSIVSYTVFLEGRWVAQLP